MTSWTKMINRTGNTNQTGSANRTGGANRNARTARAGLVTRSTQGSRNVLGARNARGALGVRDRVSGRVRRGAPGAAARWRAMRGAAADAGMSTAEYAVGTVAACGFAAVLYKVVTSSAVSSALSGMIKKALGVAF